ITGRIDCRRQSIRSTTGLQKEHGGISEVRTAFDHGIRTIVEEEPSWPACPMMLRPPYSSKPKCSRHHWPRGFRIPGREMAGCPEHPADERDWLCCGFLL